MHGNSNDRRALEREALRNVINQWNANRLDLFELSEPNEDLEFHGVMRFYFQDSGQKVATKCIRVASDATVDDVIGTLVEKFRPDMRMLSVPSYALFELHEGCSERKMADDEKPLLVQLNWHVDDREGRFLLKNVDDKTVHSMGSMDSNASFRRKLSKREKKQLKKQEKLSRMKSENGDINDDGVAEKLYTELPETSFTRSISNPEAVMRRRRQQKLEKKLQQFRSKDGGPDTGGTLKIYGEALCKDVPYKTLLLSIRDCAGAVVREMLDKYGLSRADPSQWCLVQVTQQPGTPDVEYVLDDDECPLSILMTSQNSGSIMFHVRRRPADCAPRKRKKKPAGALGGQQAQGGGGLGGGGGSGGRAGESAPVLVELGPDGTTAHAGDATRMIRLTSDVMEVGSANGIALQLYGPHIQPRHCVIASGAASDGATTLTPCHADAHTYVDGRRIHQTTPLRHGSVVKFGQHSNAYRFLDPQHEDRGRPAFGALDEGVSARVYESRSPRPLSPNDQSRDNIETTFDLDGNVETISTASGTREDNRSLGSASENRLSGLDRYPRGHDPILPAVLEFPEEPQEQFLARVITHLDVGQPTFRLAPAYALYLCARYRASTHYRPELTPTERAHKLTGLLQHAALLVRHTVQDRSTESAAQAFWLANASELLHFLKSDRHVGAFSLQAQDALADAVQLAFRNLVACLVDELNSAMGGLMSVAGDEHPRDVVNVLSGAMNLLRRCRVNAALTIQMFSQLFHWLSAKALSTIISNSNLCTRHFGGRLHHRLRSLQAWAESQGLELAAECHLAKVVQCAHLLQAPKSAPEDLASLSAVCFKLNSVQMGALLMQYKPEPGETLASPSLLEQAAKAAEGVADELARAEGREVRLHDDPSPPAQLLLPDDGFSCDVVQGVPPGLADFLQPLQAAGLCRLAAQPTSSGRWTVYMSAARPASALSATQPEVQVIRLHKAGGGMGLSIVAAKGAGQERLGIYVKSVVAGGAADRDGRLAAGDQLLAVDGHPLSGITQERAAEFLQRTGAAVTLEVAKAGAVYHGLASLLQQPSPTPHRGPRRMSERDLPSKVDQERTIPSSKSVPALHQIHALSAADHAPHNFHAPSVVDPAPHNFHAPSGADPAPHPYASRTSSSNSINNNGNAPALPNGAGGAYQTVNAGLRSRSTHNLHQQDGGFYQNLSVYRNKVPSPQHLGDRTSALRSSQNSLHSSVANSQRPSSAYYPPPASANQRPPNNNLHQSIPNLKSPPSTHRLPNDHEHSNGRSGSYPNVLNYYPAQGYAKTGFPSPEEVKMAYGSANQTYGAQGYANGGQMPLQVNAGGQMPLQVNAGGQRLPEERPQQESRFGNGGGLLREDVFRQSQASRHDEIMRYPSQGNIRISDAQIQHNALSNNPPFDLSRHNDMRTSKSEDALKHHAQYPPGDMTRYASSGNIRIEPPQPQQQQQPPREHQFAQDRHLRGAAKLAEMSEEVRRRQSRGQYAQQQQQQQQQQQYYMMAQNAQSMQNLSVSGAQLQQQVGGAQLQQQVGGAQLQQQMGGAAYQHQQQNHVSPAYKVAPVVPKATRKDDHPPLLPDLPPTATHPLYSPTAAQPPPARDPWAREERERQQEARREAARRRQEGQLRELAAMPFRTAQQEEQLRVLRLEREFQRRAMEAAEELDDDVDKDSSSSPQISPTQPPTVSSTVPPSTSAHPPAKPLDQPPSILKPNHANGGQPSPPEVAPASTIPPPPERGSSFAVMSMRAKDTTKRVSFNDASGAGNGGVAVPPTTLPIEENVREDPNSFIRQAESMLASPTTPTDASPGSGGPSAVATPGVIGAQEVYRDPRTRRLAEQAQRRGDQSQAVPEKLSFKEKMKMFAMETGERETPKDKSKISRAQRDIDNLGSPSMVH
ncbi:unnamed protein product [Phaedon cochleariae]|uniref:Afadin n=1 Tax=Phaedon cochleariae TaxID=80249 RepID=A0A9P0DGR3_PHACE|nr:unnamed protein product [Phaedon cochleariae]